MNRLTIIILSLLLFGCENSEKRSAEIEFSEENTNCTSDLREDFFITDTTITKHGSMIFWQYDQDSSWLTYEEVNGKKTILNSVYCTLMGYTYQLGTQLFDVYPNYVVFVHEWISGCCTPPDIIFMNIQKPIEIKRIASHSLIRLDGRQNLCIFFTDSTLNNAQVLNLKTDMTTNIQFPKGFFQSKIEPSGHIYPAGFFNKIEQNDNKIKIVYCYKNEISDSTWTKDSLLFNLKK